MNSMGGYSIFEFTSTVAFPSVVHVRTKPRTVSSICDCY